MQVHRRTEITIETDRVWIVRKSRSERCWCAECGREVDVAGLQEVAALPGVAQRLLSEGADGRRWHSVQTADGSPMICLDSVLRWL